ncbi:unnamed protein product [Coregonus sp. 'balchen']|nr:unnamed protein product [Coregonus sp. 'balchen']
MTGLVGVCKCSLTPNFDQDFLWGYCAPETTQPIVFIHSSRRFTDPCQVNPCQNGGICTLVPYRHSFECSCPESFTGRHCDQRNCYETIHLRYYDIGESWGRIYLRNVEWCTCVDGEISCERVRYTAHSPFEAPQNAESPCENDGTCRLITATRKEVCACRPGYSGPYCSIGENEPLRVVRLPQLPPLPNVLPDTNQINHTKPDKKPVCGKRNNKRISVARGRILGGSSALPGTHPWMAALYIGDDFCAGTLVSSCWVIRVILGQHKFNVTTRDTKTFGVEKYIFPEHFSVFNPTLHDIEVNKYTNLQETGVRIVPFERCILPEVYGNRVTSNMVCAGTNRCVDACQWKTRWVVLRKPSPVADCLVLLVYKDKSDKAQGHREKGSITLEDICGLETGLSYEGVSYTLAILCLSQVAVLGFDGKEALLAWDIRVRYSLGEVHRFSVGILPGTKLESGPAILHLCNNLLVLARDIPPVIIGQWNLPDLRRYGPVPNGFVFEGGTRCGYWAGVFFLSSMEGEQISFLFDCIVRGISPTRGPFGLRPILPDPNAAANQAYSEERVNHEAQELEKRLSMLSHKSSTASSTYGLSVAGDDRSISGSSDTSDTSQSDSSIGSRLAIWTEPVTTSSAPTETIIGQSGPKVALQAEDKLSVIQVGGARAVAKPPRSRQLQEIGRQSSSDSGIATGSHSSYSGSFSSYAGSLDIGSGGDDFGSLLSLPPHLALDLAPCTCPPAPGHEYQVPTSLRYLYDTPRNLLQGGTGGARGHQTSTTSKDHVASSPQSPPSCKSTQGEKEAPLGGRSDTVVRRSTADLLQGHSEESKSRVAPPRDPALLHWGLSNASHTRPTSSSSEYIKVDALKKTTETMSSPASVTNHSSEKLKRRNEGPAALQKKGKGKLADLLADLLGYGGTTGEPGTKTNKLNLYESMASALGRELRSQQPVINCGPLRDLNSARQGDKGTIIYENCFKCKKGEECHPPPRGTPALPRNSFVLQVGQMHHSVCFGQPLSSEPLKNGVGCEKTSNEEQPIEVQLLDPKLQDGDLPCVEVKDHSVSIEDKKQKSKEERHKVEYEIMESRALEKSSEEMVSPERPRGDGVTYVNIPISPTSKKQLNYMELEHQEQTGVRGTSQHLPGQRKSSTKYAQIDITATDAAHKTGTQHALGREEGLHTLEQRRRGVPQ